MLSTKEPVVGYRLPNKSVCQISVLLNLPPSTVGVAMFEVEKSRRNNSLPVKWLQTHRPQRTIAEARSPKKTNSPLTIHKLPGKQRQHK